MLVEIWLCGLHNSQRNDALVKGLCLASQTTATVFPIASFCRSA